MEVETCKNYILALLNRIQHPMSENDLIAIIQAFHPECKTKDIHMAVINLETERVIKSVYITEFTLNRS